MVERKDSKGQISASQAQNERLTEKVKMRMVIMKMMNFREEEIK